MEGAGLVATVAIHADKSRTDLVLEVEDADCVVFCVCYEYIVLIKRELDAVG